MTNLPTIDRSLCMGCEACVGACPTGALSLQGGAAVCDAAKCTGCGECVSACPVGAIRGLPRMAPTGSEQSPVDGEQSKAALAHELDTGHQSHVGGDAANEVWVFAEQSGGRVATVTYELLGEGRKLADALGVRLAAILLGSDTADMARTLGERGADRVYVADRPELAVFQDERYAAVISDAVRRLGPQIVLCGATAIGRSLASRIAVTVGAGLTADCTGLAIDPETHHLLQTRPAFGGNILATIETPDHRPQMATVRPKVMREAPAVPGRAFESVPLLPNAGDAEAERLVETLLRARTERVGFEEAGEDGGASLANADIIVSGGRGLQKPENFALVRELASVLGGAVGASRAAVDAGWIPYAHQVGQTGRTVCPKIYIACGISGQIQHLAGMSSSDIIVAINRDPSAPIFQHATYGLVGDALEIIPALTRAFRKRLGK